LRKKVRKLESKNERKGLEILKRIYQFGGKTFITSELFKTRKIVTYTKNIPVGWLDYPNKTETYNISFAKTKRILILGHTGSGKSFLARAIMNRAYMAGINPVIVTDTAPEYFTSQFPLQEEFKNFILDIEREVCTNGLPMKVYYPYFLYKFMGLNIPGQVIFQYRIDDIMPSDLSAFVNYEDLSLGAKLEVEDLIAKLSKESKKLSTIDELISYVASKEISNVTKRVVINALKNLKELGVFGEQYERETIIEDINQNIIPDLNLFGWQRLDFKVYVAIYISIILRKLLTARQLKKIKSDKHLLLVFEELHQFAPKKTANTAQAITKRAIQDVVLTGRKEGISTIFITQAPETIDTTIIDQCDLILVPRGFERYKLMEIVKNYLPDYYTYPYDFGISMNEYLASLRKWPDGARDWLVLEKSGEMVRITPLGPLTRHKEEGEVSV
jgi:energy-coupling factor transporter ATP-binding protein EcfA2